MLEKKKFQRKRLGSTTTEANTSSCHYFIKENFVAKTKMGITSQPKPPTPHENL